MATRVIDGPEKNWLTAKEVRELIGVGETKFAEMRKAKPPQFPPPVEVGGLALWNWKVVVWWELNFEYGQQPESAPEEEKPGDNFSPLSRAKPRQAARPENDGNDA